MSERDSGRAVWKWPIQFADEFTLSMPVDATVLTVAMQGGHPCIWALVSVDAPMAVRTFHLYGTGHNVLAGPERYIGTFQTPGAGLVFHLFEVTA